MNELAFGQREAELTADLTALRAELEKHHSQGRDRRKDESEQMTQLANHNQRLVEQLAEVCFNGSVNLCTHVASHHSRRQKQCKPTGFGSLNFVIQVFLNFQSPTYLGCDAGAFLED